MGRALRTGLVLLIASSLWASPHLRGIKISVTNPGDQVRVAEHIVIPFSELRRVAPDLNAGSLMVTATDATTVAEDAAVLQAAELPSQVDDLDGDNKADELAFSIDLKPKQTRIVTVTYGEPNRIYRLRSEYPQRTDALFATKIEGVGWESQQNAWRLYFDQRNAIDLYGKERHSLLLKTFATPEYDYHSVSPYGRDIYKIGDALGIGAVGAWVDGKAVKIGDVASREYRIVSTGPVRAIVEFEYKGWKVAGRSVTVRSRITQWAGDRGFFHAIRVDGGDGLPLVTGVPLKQNVPEFRSAAGSPEVWLATYGEQVLMPGATATEALAGTNLGLAVILIGTKGTPVQDADNRLLQVQSITGTATWYVSAAWDQEGVEDRISVGKPDDMRRFVEIANPDSLKTQAAFLGSVKDDAARLSAPASVSVLSAAAEAQSPPPDTLSPASHKTYAQAISALQAEIDRTATKWEPILRSNSSITTKSGAGFFTEGDNRTGEWKKENGFFWTGSFWTGELWKMYGATKNEKYRRWAELWTRASIGQEGVQNHDTGFLYYYSSILGYEQTKNPEYLESAKRAAQRLDALYNPKTHLIAAWQVGGDDTIVDTMMNLQLLWWVWKQTGDDKWKEIGLNHALRTAEWMVRPDGSVFQSVHYNPGDDRQRFELRGGAPSVVELNWKNDVASGQPIFLHTHQGFTSDTSWSRGQAWALYGFTVGFQATKDERLLKTAQKIAGYILEELPEDGVPWYDFYDEGVLFRNRDSSAAAIIASALVRLAGVTQDQRLAAKYRAEGERITQSLIERYLTPVSQGDATPPGVLRHGSATRPSDVPLIYGQYYLLEVLLELQGNNAAVAQ